MLRGRRGIFAAYDGFSSMKLAESTTLEDASVDFGTRPGFHWFEPEKTRAEFGGFCGRKAGRRHLELP